METINNEIIYQIALNLPIEDLITLCQTNIRIYNFCNHEWFWKQRFRKDFPNISDQPPIELPPFTIESMMSEQEPIPITLTWKQ